MEASGDAGARLVYVNRSIDAGSGHSPWLEGRAAALQFLANTVLSEREEEGDDEGAYLCSDILLSFINSLENWQWENIRERMRQPLTQAHLAQVSRRIVRVVLELVFQLLIPTLMDRLQSEDFSGASDSESHQLNSHREEEAQRKVSSSSVMTPVDSLEASVVMHDLHRSSAASGESSVDSMAGVVRSFLDEAEHLFIRESSSSLKKVDAGLSWLEELISQDKLVTFSKDLADKLAFMFHQQKLSVSDAPDDSRLTWSDSEVSQSMSSLGFTQPSKQVYLFTEEAVKHLLKSFIFPPPSWGMMIQVQSSLSSARGEESAEDYEDVIDTYSRLMADEVMEGLSRTSAASRLSRDDGDVLPTEREEKKNIIQYFHEFLNKIRRKWGTLINKEV